MVILTYHLFSWEFRRSQKLGALLPNDYVGFWWSSHIFMTIKNVCYRGGKVIFLPFTQKHIHWACVLPVWRSQFVLSLLRARSWKTDKVFAVNMSMGRDAGSPAEKKIFSSCLLCNFREHQFSISRGFAMWWWWWWTAFMKLEEKHLAGSRRQRTMNEQSQRENSGGRAQFTEGSGGVWLPLSVEFGARCCGPMFLIWTQKIEDGWTGLLSLFAIFLKQNNSPCFSWRCRAAREVLFESRHWPAHGLWLLSSQEVRVWHEAREVVHGVRQRWRGTGYLLWFIDMEHGTKNIPIYLGPLSLTLV